MKPPYLWAKGPLVIEDVEIDKPISIAKFCSVPWPAACATATCTLSTATTPFPPLRVSAMKAAGIVEEVARPWTT